LLTCTPEVSKKYNLKNLKEYLLFVHDIHKREESKTIVVSDQGKVIVDHIFKNIKNRFNKKLSIIRSKANLQTQFTDNNNSYHNTPHKDFDLEHTVALYYVNDSDGDTILFNKDMTIKEKVSPKAGRLLFFDGSILHTGSHPVLSKYRMCVNIDLTEEAQ